MNGRPMTINWMNRNVPAILEGIDSPGRWGKQAIPEVLLGRLRLLPQEAPGDVPEDSGTNCRWTSRTSRARYWGSAGTRGVLYPFGHGLSYTEFRYSGTQDRTGGGGAYRFRPRHLRMQNAGKVDGDEVVQLYVRDDVSSVTTYVKICAGP